MIVRLSIADMMWTREAAVKQCPTRRRTGDGGAG